MAAPSWAERNSAHNSATSRCALATSAAASAEDCASRASPVARSSTLSRVNRSRVECMEPACCSREYPSLARPFDTAKPGVPRAVRAQRSSISPAGTMAASATGRGVELSPTTEMGRQTRFKSSRSPTTNWSSDCAKGLCNRQLPGNGDTWPAWARPAEMAMEATMLVRGAAPSRAKAVAL